MPICFAIMPISTPPDYLDRYYGDNQHFLRVAKHIFKPAVEAAGFEFRAPSVMSSEIIEAYSGQAYGLRPSLVRAVMRRRHAVAE